MLARPGATAGGGAALACAIVPRGHKGRALRGHKAPLPRGLPPPLQGDSGLLWEHPQRVGHVCKLLKQQQTCSPAPGRLLAVARRWRSNRGEGAPPTRGGLPSPQGLPPSHRAIPGCCGSTRPGRPSCNNVVAATSCKYLYTFWGSASTNAVTASNASAGMRAIGDF